MELKGTNYFGDRIKEERETGIKPWGQERIPGTVKRPVDYMSLDVKGEV